MTEQNERQSVAVFPRERARRKVIGAEMRRKTDWKVTAPDREAPGCRGGEEHKWKRKIESRKKRDSSKNIGSYIYSVDEVVLLNGLARKNNPRFENHNSSSHQAYVEEHTLSGIQKMKL